MVEGDRPALSHRESTSDILGNQFVVRYGRAFAGRKNLTEIL